MIATGTRIASYEITALLGAGGMGEVYRARDSRLGRDVALKVLAPRLAANRDAIARFEQEARSASALSHPHILHIYDIGSTEINGAEMRYMTMELVDGATLSKKMQSSELRDLLGWLAQVADGLAKAHDAGIVHRDLKPENVMVTSDGYAKILDFGLAKLVERPLSGDEATMVGGAPQSVPGLILGTVAYMSPEQAQGKPADARTDIFAFGAILYEVAARRRAFDGSSLVDTMHKVVHSDPDFSILDERIARVARKCLAKDPAARYASIRDVARELRDITNPQAARATSTAHEGKTIAVLPFDDLSPNRDNEYFADGLAEEITSDLSKIRSFRVLSRASVRKYRGEDKVIGRVHEELGAQYVIDGSVRKAGNQLRITAQLIDARSATQIWSEKYSGTLDEVFDIQENVARSVAKRLEVELTSGENAMLAHRSMSNIEAFDCYLRARRLIWRFDEEGLDAALKEIERGLAIAGPNPALLGAQGYVYWQYYNAGIRPDPAYLDRAEEIAKTILESDPDSLHGLRLSGLVAIQRQQMRRGFEIFERVLSIDPNDLDSLLWITLLCAFVGRDSRAYEERLVAIDPLGSFTWAMRSVHPLYNGRYDEALALIQRARALEGVPLFDVIYVQILTLAGRTAEAMAIASALEKSQPGQFLTAMAVALTFAAMGDGGRVRAALTEDVLRIARADFQYSGWIADVYAAIGDTDEALEWLAHWVGRGFTAWPFLAKHDRFLDLLRGMPRFEEIVEQARTVWESYQ